MKLHLILDRPLAFFDLETTGTTIGKDRIIEISIVRVDTDGTEGTPWTQRINPEMPLAPIITELTGITDADLKDKPLFKEVAEKIKQQLKGCDLAGYNSNKFDVPFLLDEFYRVGIEFEVAGRRLIDVQNIFHKMEPRTLSAAYKFYCEKDLTNAHAADADTLATLEIFKAQLDRYKETKDLSNPTPDSLHKFTNLHNTVDLAGRLVYNEQGEEIINFGKHKGKKIDVVFSTEPSYYSWIMQGDFSRETKAVFERLKKKFDESQMIKKLQNLKENFPGKV